MSYIEGERSEDVAGGPVQCSCTYIICHCLITQDCGNTLAKALCEVKARVEELSKSVDRVMEQLNESEGAEKRLKGHVDGMAATRVKRDRKTAGWRSKERSMFVELDSSRRAQDQLRVALARQDDECALAERSAAKDAYETRREITRLTNDLTRRRSTVDVLRARVDELETDRPSPQSCFVDSNQHPRDLNQMPESRRNAEEENEDDDDDDGNDDDDDRDDFVTCECKSTDGSSTAADCSTTTEYEIPFLEWLELMSGYSNKPTADDGDGVSRNLTSV